MSNRNATDAMYFEHENYSEYQSQAFNFVTLSYNYEVEKYRRLRHQTSDKPVQETH